MNFIKRLLGIPRGLHGWEIEEVRAMVRAIQTEKFKAHCMSQSPKLFRNEDILTQKAMVGVLEKAKDDHLRGLFGRLGYPNGTNLSLNLATGKVKIVEIRQKTVPLTEMRYKKDTSEALTPPPAPTPVADKKV